MVANPTETSHQPITTQSVLRVCLSPGVCLSWRHGENVCLDTRTQYLLLTDEQQEDDLVPDLPQAQTLHASLQSKIHFRSTYQISLSPLCPILAAAASIELDLIMID